ncbi:hydrogenase maturation protein [Nitrosophilus alvini]|uniref:hydrogenase maturation protein n=1 Tax=Nitrosophilus alvini TaxID=2714855 RepID=UPI00190A0FE4|nr:hydrogenase maturation protein [Nitrosophilus alvini]
MKERTLKILLIVTAFNSLTQRIFCELRDAGHEVSVEYAINNSVMEEAVELFKPDLIICPYLTKKIPESIWKKITTIIIHPGPKGDRGPSSLDWAVMKNVKVWGVTALQANSEMDAGDIWASETFEMRDASKASIYRREVAALASRLVKEVLRKFRDKNFIPEKQDLSKPDYIGRPHSAMKQADRQIDWTKDDTDTVIKKIRASDSIPGVLDNILGLECYLYGAHKEDILRGRPGEVLAKRYGAICIGTVDGAVWITHLKEKAVKSMKLPATFVLKSRLKGIKESRIPLVLEEKRETFKEIWFEQKADVGYLYFNFYNGAMSSEQCMRLKYAIEYLKEKDIKLLVLMGGEDFFSNGIHLNILEDSQKKAEDGWSNIHSMNELVKTILYTEEFLTVAAVRGNAGAGGVFLALACDFVIAREGVVLNPHYKTMGLYGSEYWTYTLPKRVGENTALRLTEECLPVSASKACKLGLVDKVFDEDFLKFHNELEKFCCKLADSDEFYNILDEKIEKLELQESIKPLQTYRDMELEKMRPSFFDETSEFHKLRHDFVYKVCPISTPNRIAFHRKKLCMNTV